MSKAQISLISTILLTVIVLTLPLFLTTQKNTRNYQKEFLEKSFNELMQTSYENITLNQAIILNNCEKTQFDYTKIFTQYFNQKKYLIKINEETFTNDEKLITKNIIYKDNLLNKKIKLQNYCNQDLTISLTLL